MSDHWPTEIPVLDLSAGAGSGSMATLAEAFLTAYRDTGFAYIVGHGVDPGLRAAVFDAARAFHALPLAEKHALAVNDAHRGYIAINTSTDVTSDLANVTKPNQSASFMIMREDASADPNVYLSGPNQWPNLASFRDACEAYIAAMTDLGQRLMRLALDSLGVTDDSILSAFEPPTLWLRLLHYPPQPAQSPDDLYGAAPHRDFGCLTLLAQDDVGGLQVQTPAGDWIDVAPKPDAFIVNVGDMLHRMSNGRLRSTPHRVINRSGRERYSVPFFFDPHVSTVIEPLPGTGAAKFEPLLFGAFLRAELEAGYDAHKPSQDAPVSA